MRKILFRGKRTDNDAWVEGFYQEYPTGYVHIQSEYNDWFPVYPETVGQFTGMLDINGNKIFEGDIMKTAIGGITQHTGVVKFSDGSFGLRCEDNNGYFLCFVAGSYTIIGNIHDNPELMIATVKE